MWFGCWLERAKMMVRALMAPWSGKPGFVKIKGQTGYKENELKEKNYTILI